VARRRTVGGDFERLARPQPEEAAKSVRSSVFHIPH
jgi:hypothetical protein